LLNWPRFEAATAEAVEERTEAEFSAEVKLGVDLWMEEREKFDDL
jgi:hypothetical protein